MRPNAISGPALLLLRRPLAVWFAGLVVSTWAHPAAAVELVEIRHGEGTRQISGRLVSEAQDGGVLVLATDGVLWGVQPQSIVKRSRDESPFKPLSQEQMGKALLAEMPAGFQLHTTQHYVVCYNTSKAYAQWCGELYERLFAAFQAYWKSKGIKLRDPEMPLVALVFDGKESYARYAQEELGPTATAIIGYYSLRTNRVVMYDLAGVESQKAGEKRPATPGRINEILQRPRAERTVATVIHEATHQLAFNCGLQQRYADIPLWVSEGIANFFETPDLRSAKGWRGADEVNPSRLADFREYLSRRPADSLETLLRDGKRFQKAETMVDSYAEAWALNYFLLHRRSADYTRYLNQLAAKEALFDDRPEERLAAFKAVFGEDLPRLDAEFLQFVRKLR